MLIKDCTSQNENLINEAIQMNSNRHKNLISMYGVGFIKSNPTCIVLEYADLGDLLVYLRKQRDSNVSELLL